MRQKRKFHGRGEFGGGHEEVVVKDCQKALEIMVKPEVIEDVSEKKGTE